MTGQWLIFSLLVMTLSYSHLSYGQGAAVVMPLSKYVVAADEVISFFIHNRLDNKELILRYTPKCDVEGADIEGEACLKTFAVSFDIAPKKDVIKIPAGGRLRGDVRLLAKEIGYALFKPHFLPLLEEKAEPSSVRFDFSYQPGYLFIVKPQKERLSKIAFDTYAINSSRRLRMKLDISSLSAPQVLSVSTKLLDVKNKKLIQFVKLASEKIVDPKRKQLELESEFAGADDKREVCYQAFIEALATKDFYQISNCK